MPLVMLTNGAHAEVDEADAGLVAQLRWRVSASGYAMATTAPHAYMHRVICAPPPGVEVDHINGNRLDNRRANLRTCERQQNAMNVRAHRDGGSRFKGVSVDRRTGRWVAFIKAKSTHRYLGSFTDEVSAALAYDTAAREMHGEFACLNLPGVVMTQAAIEQMRVTQSVRRLRIQATCLTADACEHATVARDHYAEQRASAALV